MRISNVLSDTFGKTATKIIEYVLTCETFDPEYCKTLIHPRVKASPDDVIKSVLGYNLSLAQASKIRISKAHLNSVDTAI
jgi:hypothetical protein